MGKDAVGTLMNDSAGAWAGRTLSSIPATYTVFYDNIDGLYRVECNGRSGTDDSGTDAGALINSCIANNRYIVVKDAIPSLDTTIALSGITHCTLRFDAPITLGSATTAIDISTESYWNEILKPHINLNSVASAVGVSISGSYYNTVRNAYVYGSPTGYGAKIQCIDNIRGCYFNIFENIELSCLAYGLYIDDISPAGTLNANSNTFRSIFLDQIGTYGVYLGGAGGNMFYQLHAQGSAADCTTIRFNKAVNSANVANSNQFFAFSDTDHIGAGTGKALILEAGTYLNNFYGGGITAGNVTDSANIGANKFYHINGWCTSSCGEAVITNGNTSVDVTHNLNYTPWTKHISINPVTNWGNMTEYWFGNLLPNTFTIYADADPGEDVVFRWDADINRAST